MEILNHTAERPEPDATSNHPMPDILCLQEVESMTHLDCSMKRI